MNNSSVATVAPAIAGRLSSHHPASFWKAQLGCLPAPQLPCRLTEQREWGGGGETAPAEPSRLFFFFFPAAVRVRWGPSGSLIRLSPLYLVIVALPCLQALSLYLPVCMHFYVSLLNQDTVERIWLPNLFGSFPPIAVTSFSHLFIHSNNKHFCRAPTMLQVLYWVVLGGGEEKGREERVWRCIK